MENLLLELIHNNFLHTRIMNVLVMQITRQVFRIVWLLLIVQKPVFYQIAQSVMEIQSIFQTVLHLNVKQICVIKLILWYLLKH